MREYCTAVTEKPVPNIGQRKMAGQVCSDMLPLLIIFILADRLAGGKPATFFGRNRWAQVKRTLLL